MVPDLSVAEQAELAHYRSTGAIDRLWAIREEGLAAGRAAVENPVPSPAVDEEAPDSDQQAWPVYFWPGLLARAFGPGFWPGLLARWPCMFARGQSDKVRPLKF